MAASRLFIVVESSRASVAAEAAADRASESDVCRSCALAEASSRADEV